MHSGGKQTTDDETHARADYAIRLDAGLEQCSRSAGHGSGTRAATTKDENYRRYVLLLLHV
jgi:hypothetical protein